MLYPENKQLNEKKKQISFAISLKMSNTWVSVRKIYKASAQKQKTYNFLYNGEKI